jgi:hypothetical protein
MTSVTAQRLLTANGPVECPRIDIDDAGIIVAIESDQAGADDVTLTPAFFDIHVHGAAGRDVMEGTAEALEGMGAFLATRGVAHYLATTVTAPLDKTLRALEGIANAIESTAHRGDGALARPVGIHLEGPFISHAKRGVHAEADLLPAKVSIFQKLQQAARGHIKLMTVAPELPEALELIEYAVASATRTRLRPKRARPSSPAPAAPPIPSTRCAGWITANPASPAWFSTLTSCTRNSSATASMLRRSSSACGSLRKVQTAPSSSPTASPRQACPTATIF